MGIGAPRRSASQRTASGRLARERVLDHRVQVAPFVDDEQLGPLLERRRDEAIPTGPQVRGGRRHDPGATRGHPTRGPHEQVVERRAGPRRATGGPGRPSGAVGAHPWSGRRPPRRRVRACRRMPRRASAAGSARLRLGLVSSASARSLRLGLDRVRLGRLGLVRVVERPHRRGRLVRLLRLVPPLRRRGSCGGLDRDLRPGGPAGVGAAGQPRAPPRSAGRLRPHRVDGARRAGGLGAPAG